MSDKRTPWKTVEEVVSPAELHWFPLMVGDWLGSTAISMMLIEQEGAYGRLLKLAWGKGNAEPSLPADDATLAQMSKLGSRWKKLGPLVRAQFDERDGKLYNEKLTTVWIEQQWKHASVVARASAGGKAKAKLNGARGELEPPPQGVPQEVPQAEPENAGGGANIEPEGEAKPLTGVLPSPDLDGKSEAAPAAGPDGPRGRDAGWDVEDPYEAIEKSAAPAVARQHEIETDLFNAYLHRRDRVVENWRKSHEAEYETHRIAVITKMGWRGKQLSPEKQRIIDSETAARITTEQGWPSKAEWCEAHRGRIAIKRAEAQARRAREAAGAAPA